MPLAAGRFASTELYNEFGVQRCSAGRDGDGNYRCLSDLELADRVCDVYGHRWRGADVYSGDATTLFYTECTAHSWRGHVGQHCSVDGSWDADCAGCRCGQ